MPDDINWKLWTEMCLRELTQLRVDLDRHLTEHRDDINKLDKRIEDLRLSLTGMITTNGDETRKCNETQNLAIQKLQIESEKEEEAPSPLPKSDPTTKYSVILSGTIIALYEILKYVSEHLPHT